MPSTEENDTETDSEPETRAERDTEGWTWLLRRREVMLSMVGLIVVIFTLLLGRVSDTLLLITPSGDSIAFPDVEASFCKYFSLSFLFLLSICIVKSSFVICLFGFYHVDHVCVLLWRRWETQDKIANMHTYAFIYTYT